MSAEQECPDCGKPMDEAYAYVSGVCSAHGVRVVNLDLAELQAAQQREREAWEAQVETQRWADQRLQEFREQLKAAQELARDLISYRHLREKVRLREDQTEYEEAKRLIARFDAFAAQRTEEPSE